MLKRSEIAAIAHEQNRIYCESQGDNSQVYWDEAEEWQTKSAINGVDAIADGKVTGPGDSHRNWMAEKEEDGWIWGEVKDTELKTHPDMMPFEELSAAEQFKDHLFFTTVFRLLQLSAKFAHA